MSMTPSDLLLSAVSYFGKPLYLVKGMEISYSTFDTSISLICSLNNNKTRSMNFHIHENGLTFKLTKIRSKTNGIPDNPFRNCHITDILKNVE